MKKKVEKARAKKKESNKINYIVLIGVLIIVVAYFISVYYYNFDVLKRYFDIELPRISRLEKIEKCETRICFEAALEKCKRAEYIYDSENVWEYKIDTEEGNNCLVYAKLLQIKQGISESEKLEGKEMLCKIPLGTIEYPGRDLLKCSGELKEKVQEILIKRMHSYIVENIGKIAEELQKVV